MSKIFICYRRDDSSDVVGRIYDHLIATFGNNRIFKDVDSIPAGEDFRKYIEQSVQFCDVALVIIGKKWLGLSDGSSNRRIDNPTDVVRVEIELCLSRKIPIIPVLVSGALMPNADDLPQSIQQLAYQNGLVVRTDPDFRRDIAKLINSLSRIIKFRKSHKHIWYLLLALIVGATAWIAPRLLEETVTERNSSGDLTKPSQSIFLGALDGIYEGEDKNNPTQLTIKNDTNELVLLVRNCAFIGTIAEADSYWSVIAQGQDGMCHMIDGPFIGKEVGRITPVKGHLANSGRVLKVLLNFSIGSLSQFSGIYNFKYNDLDALRQSRGFDK